MWDEVPDWGWRWRVRPGEVARRGARGCPPGTRGLPEPPERWEFADTVAPVEPPGVPASASRIPRPRFEQARRARVSCVGARRCVHGVFGWRGRWLNPGSWIRWLGCASRGCVAVCSRAGTESCRADRRRADPRELVGPPIRPCDLRRSQPSSRPRPLRSGTLAVRGERLPRARLRDTVDVERGAVGNERPPPTDAPRAPVCPSLEPEVTLREDRAGAAI
jgi:hypothetical protein